MERSANMLILSCLLISIAALNNCKKEEKNLPSLITVPASGIATNTAILGGIVGDDGGAEIISRGVCWGTEPTPSISGSKNIIGEGTGIFTCTLTELNPNTLYYVRAYAVNSEGIAYGGEVRFTTNPAIPATLSTIVNYDVDYFGAWVGIYITDDGGTTITEKGICWATTENPTVVDNDKIICYDRNPGDLGCYWSYAGPLKPKTDYHVRAYAINGTDISYGDDKLFTTLAVPEVTTVAATELTDSTATVGGNVTSLGDVEGDIVAGICYGTEKDPAIEGLHIEFGATGTGEFVCNLTNLTPGTLYYARAYVLVFEWLWWIDLDLFSEFYIYGNEVTFTTH